MTVTLQNSGGSKPRHSNNMMPKDGFVNHYEDNKVPDQEQSMIIGKLMDGYKKFETRKVPKKPVYFRNPRIPLIVTKQQLTLQYRDVMVFESLDLKRKLRGLFSKNIRALIGQTGASDGEGDNSHSDSERKSTFMPRSEEGDKKAKINNKIAEHMKHGSLSGLSASGKSN